MQLTWPHCDTEWYELEKVLECYVDIASNILKYEPLMIVTRDIDECKADIARITERKGIVLDVDSIRFYESPLNDTWARDTIILIACATAMLSGTEISWLGWLVLAVKHAVIIAACILTTNFVFYNKEMMQMIKKVFQKKS